MVEVLVVGAKIRILRDELRFSFVRSSGPGGQNVNKVNSKAVLCWEIGASPSVPGDVRTRFLAKYHRRISEDGRLILTSQRYRDQYRNVCDCLDKLRAMVAAVAMPPKQRKRSRPSRAAVERRLRAKRERSTTKQRRREQPRLES